VGAASSKSCGRKLHRVLRDLTRIAEVTANVDAAAAGAPFSSDEEADEEGEAAVETTS